MISCSGSTILFDSNEINSIEIKASATKQEIVINDKNVISVFVNDYINKNKKNISKFLSSHSVIFNYGGEEILIITNGFSIKCKGKTYKLKKNIDEFISTLYNLD